MQAGRPGSRPAFFVAPTGSAAHSHEGSVHGPFTAEFIFHALRPPWAVGLLLLFGLVGYQVITWNDLPRCHELRTKDALSKIISERQGEVSTYDEINTVSELDNET